MDINTIVCADALDFLRGLPDGSVDMFLTSPPYDNLRKYNGFTWDFEGIARETFRVIKPGGVLVWVVGDSVIDGSESLTSFKQALYFRETVGYRLHDTMISGKDGAPFPDFTRYSNVFEYMFVLSKGKPKSHNLIRTKTIHKPGRPTFRQPDGKLLPVMYEMGHETKPLENIWRLSTGFNKSTRDTISFEHPATFPEELAERHILTWTNPGELVCDFFMGSGTTAKMARNNGRSYIGCDISPEYVAIAQQRLAMPYTLPLFTETQTEPPVSQMSIFETAQ